MTPVLYVPFRPIFEKGLALRWVILINREYRDNKKLIQHEKIHIAQQKKYGMLTYAYRYLTSERFRAKMEYHAFKYGSEISSRGHIAYKLVKYYRISPQVACEVSGADRNSLDKFLSP